MSKRIQTIISVLAPYNIPLKMTDEIPLPGIGKHVKDLEHQARFLGVRFNTDSIQLLWLPKKMRSDDR